MRTGRQMPEQSLHQVRGFDRFIEAHGDPRRDIALRAHDFLGLSSSYGWQGRSQRRSNAWPLARPAKPVRPKLLGQRGRDARPPRATGRAIRHVRRRWRAALSTSVRMASDRLGEQSRARGLEIDARPARYHEVHEVTLAERLVRWRAAVAP